jgi:cellulose synthase/poly-beta-1,6-N-acetylglucosamine synthase-like glycosyltransferase
MILLIILLFIGLIILLIDIILLASFPDFKKKPRKSTNYLDMSIVIAMKNEVKNLENLFSSLETQNYPKDKFEVILIDDDSTDNSYQKAVEFSNAKANYRVLKTKEKKYPGKKGALDFGIGNAIYPYILITDADCMPANNWLAGYSEKFTENFDFLFGIAPFIQSKGIINKTSCFENLRSSILTFSFARLNLPYSAAARNFGFTISAFKRLGGFGNTLETQSGDDDLLIREAVKNKLKIGVVDFEKSYVTSNPKSSLNEFLNQKARHTKTSHYYLPIHQFLLGLWHLLNILSLASILFLTINPLFVLPFITKMLIDTISVLIIQKKFQYTFRIHEIPLLQMLYEIFLVVNFLTSFRKNIPWKD